jgi:lysozyme
MSDTETTEEVELEETRDIEGLEGSNAVPDHPEDGAVTDAEPEATEDEVASRGFSIGKLSQPGAGFIARFEGCVLRMYNDPTNNATIGVGHLIHMGPINGREPPDFKRGITRQRALEMLMGDAGKASTGVHQLIKVQLNQHQLDALISFAFNCGTGSLAISTLRQKLNHGNYAAVPSELNKWVFSSGKRLPGLVRRRQAEGALFSHGKYM